MKVNGKNYPLWGQFVDRKEEWIGGILEDFGDSIDSHMGFNGAKGEIADIVLDPNGDTSAYFQVLTADGWGCGFDVSCGVISGDPKNEKGWITFHGYGGHKWRIKQKAT